jgi:hypothetical protein
MSKSEDATAGMTSQRILELLPSGLHWAVMFRCEPILSIAGESILRRMFFLPDDCDLVGVSHVILTSHGRAVFRTGLLQFVDSREVEDVRDNSVSLHVVCQDELRQVPADEPDCLGLGQLPGFGPTALHVVLYSGIGHATAVFDREPDQSHYELLRGVGVTYQGGDWRGRSFVARFKNQLTAHIRSGVDAGFSRTANCNLFFLRHGSIDEDLLTGLLDARKNCIHRALLQAQELCARLAFTATRKPLYMTCQEFGSSASTQYGDVVPLGICQYALRDSRDEQLQGVAEVVNQYLTLKAEDGLFPFHSGRLRTATDTLLTSLGCLSRESESALGKFLNSDGGYLPQLSSSEERIGEMLAGAPNEHWRQSDFFTTCLALAGIETQSETTLQWVLARVPNRSGLFVANPYFVDFAAVMGLKNVGTRDASNAVAVICREILSSQNSDGSFGKYDVAFSTALASAALSIAGWDCEATQRSQFWLALLTQSGRRSPTPTPFFSSFIVSRSDLKSERHYFTVRGSTHELSLYRDQFRMVETAFLTKALQTGRYCDSNRQFEASGIHERYLCSSVEEYVTKFALPPYVSFLEDRTMPGNG